MRDAKSCGSPLWRAARLNRLRRSDRRPDRGLPAAAAGPADAVAGQPLAFTTGAAGTSSSTQATLHIGAVYLDESRPVSGGQATGCYLTGTYVAQETSGLDVDLLNPGLQLFPAKAHGITEPPALIGQVWLTGGDINASTDPTPILVVAGTATQTGATGGPLPLHRNGHHQLEPQASSSGAAGGDPICKARIVTPIDAVPIQTTRRAAPAHRSARTTSLASTSVSCRRRRPRRYAFSDDPISGRLLSRRGTALHNLRQTAPYTFSWTDSL